MAEQQQIVFDQVKAMLQKHMPPLAVLKDEPGDFQVTGGKPVVIGKRKMDYMWFGAVMARKSGVVLHFMPVYMNPVLAEKLPPIFLKTLKGKACFHVGKFGPELAEATESAIAIGIEAYKSRDWL